MISEMVVCFAMEAFDGGVLERPIHALDLSIGPRVARFSQPVFDAVLGACVFVDVYEERLALIHDTADFCDVDVDRRAGRF